MTDLKFSHFILSFLIILISIVLNLDFSQELRKRKNDSLVDKVSANEKETITSDVTDNYMIKHIKMLPVLKSKSLDDRNNLSLDVTNVTARSYLVLDVKANQVLLAKNEHEIIYPASTTKIMTALVARDIYSEEQIFEVEKAHNVNGNGIDLNSKESLTVDSLLHALLIASANDCAFVLANSHQQGYNSFIELMNQKAKQLNLSKTHFTNPSGLDHEQHYTTAYDLVMMSFELISDDYLRDIVKTKQMTIQDVSGRYSHFLYNTNQLLGKYSIQGLKTGTTPLGGQVLISYIKRKIPLNTTISLDETEINQDSENMKLSEQEIELIMIVANSQDRYQDTTNLMKFIYNNYYWKELN